jgi:hypothetical protein
VSMCVAEIAKKLLEVVLMWVRITVESEVINRGFGMICGR